MFRALVGRIGPSKTFPACFLLLALWLAPPARAAESDVYCLTGTSSTGAPSWAPASSAQPCPVTAGTAPATSTPTTEAGFTVTTGNTFQQVLAANSARTSCFVQNTSTHMAYAYFLGFGTASLTNAVQVPAGSGFYCATGAGGVIRTAIQWTTGTTSDPGVATENQ